MAQVKIGTCSVTNGSASVTGVGTNWLTTVLTDQPSRPNPSFAIAGGSAVYTVASVESDTALTLTAPYGGDSATGVNYSITVDFTPNLGLSEINKGDQDWALHLTEGVIRKLDEVIPSISSGGSVDVSNKEDKTNKDTDSTLGANSDVKYPSQKAVKSYVDNRTNQFSVNAYRLAIHSDDTAAFQAAVVAAENSSTRGVVYVSRDLVLSSTIRVKKDRISIQGTPGVRLIRSGDYGDTILVEPETSPNAGGFLRYFSIEGIQFVSTTKMTSGAHLHLNQVYSQRIGNVDFIDGLGGILLEGGCWTQYLDNVNIATGRFYTESDLCYGIKTIANMSTTLPTKWPSAMWINNLDLKFSYENYGPPVDLGKIKYGLWLESVDALYANNMHINYTSDAHIYIHPQSGGLVDVQLTGCYLDGATRGSVEPNNILIDLSDGGTVALKVTGGQFASRNTGGGLYGNGIKQVGSVGTLSRLQVTGAVFDGLVHGIDIANADRVQLTGNDFMGNTNAIILGSGVVEYTVTGNDYRDSINGFTDSTTTNNFNYSSNSDGIVKYGSIYKLDPLGGSDGQGQLSVNVAPTLTSAARGIVLDRYSGTPTLLFRRLDGTKDVPLAVAGPQTTDSLGVLSIHAWDGAEFVTAAQLNAQALENIDSTHRGTQMVWSVGKIGSNTTVRAFGFSSNGILIDPSGIIPGVAATSELEVKGTVKIDTLEFSSDGSTQTTAATPAVPGGVSSNVQINNSGTFGGDGNFTYINTGVTHGVYLGTTSNTVFGVYAPASYGGGRTVVFGVDTNAGYSYFGDTSAASLPSSGQVRVMGDINITGDFKKNGVVIGGGGGSGTVTSITPGAGFTSTTPITTSGTLNVDVGTTSGKIASFDSSNGLNIPSGGLAVGKTGISASTDIEAYSTTRVPVLRLYDSRDTAAGGGSIMVYHNRASNALPAAADRLGILGGGYWDSTTTRTPAAITFWAGSTPSAGTIGTAYVAIETVATAGGSRTERFRVSEAGNIVLGTQSALATNATDGFTYIPTCAGTPSGVPTDYTGKSAMIHDTTGNKLWVYNHVTDTWKGTTLA